MRQYCAVLAGGAAGSLLRFVIASAILSRFPSRFPWGTWLINVSGSFLIGVLMTLLTERFSAHPHWRFLLVVGFLGGYTTFSSFEWETYIVAREGQSGTALLYVMTSVLAGYAAVWLGAQLTQRR